MALDLNAIIKMLNPTGATSNAPVYSANNPAAAMAGGSMGAGWMNQGVKAFLPGDLNAFDFSNTNNTDDATGTYGPLVQRQRAEALASTMAPVAQLANKLGYNTSGYNLADPGRLNLQYDLGAQLRDQAYQRAGMKDPTAPNYAQSASGLYDTLNNDLSRFARIRSASAGWDGRNNPRSTAETMYFQGDNGDWNPIGPSKFGVKQEHKGWAREDGAETIAGLSMLMPAFGGWAGLLGNGVQGTLTAGGGLGLTGGLGSTIGTGLTNTLVNTAVQSAMNGGFNPTSLLTGLGMSAAGNLASGNGLGNMFNTNVPTGPAAAPTTLSGLFNSSIGSAIRSSPFFRTEGGAYANQGMGAIQQLARLFK